MLLIMLAIMTTMFPWLSHPLSMGFLLIMQTTLIAMMTGSMISSFWFSYILLITMLSGMLVLFIYMATIASNESFSFNMTLPMISSPMILLMGLWITQDKIMNNLTKTTPTPLIEYQQMPELNLILTEHTMMITLMMVTYLLFTMIVVTFLTKPYHGAMRSN